MLTTFRVGERPSRPLVITLTDAAGGPVDLGDYNEPEIEGGLPAGTVTVLDGPGGVLQYDFSAAFTAPGVVPFRVRLPQADGSVDYSPWFEVAVEGTRAASFVTPTQAWDITGKPVSPAALTEAQAFISAILRRDLADTEWRGGLSTSDLTRLRQAVAWQAVYEPLASGIEVPAGATRVKTGDVEVQFGATGPQTGPQVAPLAGVALRGLSWRRTKTVHASPHTVNDRPLLPPNLWVPVSTGGRLR